MNKKETRPHLFEVLQRQVGDGIRVRLSLLKVLLKHRLPHVGVGSVHLGRDRGFGQAGGHSADAATFASMRIDDLAKQTRIC